MVADVIFQREYDFPYPINPGLIVDAGANIGCATRYFRDRFPGATILALEPDPANYEVLVKNCPPADRLVCMNKGLWPVRAQLNLDYGIGAECAVRTTPLNPAVEVGPSASPVCETVTMHDIISSYGKVDILKIDIEGAEAELFSPRHDLSWLLDVSAIAIELHDRYEPGCSRHFWLAVKEFPFEACNRENLYVSRALPEC